MAVALRAADDALAQGHAQRARDILDSVVQGSTNDEWRSSKGRVLYALGVSALSDGQTKEALEFLSIAINVDPTHVEAHFSLGNLMLMMGDSGRAEQSFRLALAIDPNHAGALGNLGGLMSERGALQEAETLWERSLGIEPNAAPIAFNLGMARVRERRWSEAASLLRQSLSLDARQPDAAFWLGNALMGAGHAPEARAAYEQAIKLDGGFAKARWGRAMAALPALPQSASEQLDAPAIFRSELIKLRSWVRAQRPGDAVKAVGAQQPFYIAYINQDHRRVLGEYGQLCSGVMEKWNARPSAPAVIRHAGSKFKLGIVSAHVQDHSVWHAVVRGWVEHLSSQEFELTLCYTGTGDDEQTRWARQHVAHFVHGESGWESWARRIADSALDAIVYPEIGMDATTLRLASQRLAPLQAASWGHPITTGLPSIDVFFSAEAMEPSNAESHYTERLIRLPGIGCSYQPYGVESAATVDLSRWGIGSHDRLLVCAGVPNKYAPGDDAIWVDLARRCAPCKLVFFAPSYNDLGAMLSARLRRAFDAAGVPFEDAVRFLPWLPRSEFFALLDRSTAMVDTVGFSGFNTAMQAFERQTPLMAWEGPFLRGRLASGPLREMGMADWIASKPATFVAGVERLCNDKGLADQVRHRLQTERERLYGQVGSVSALGAALVAQRVARA